MELDLREMEAVVHLAEIYERGKIVENDKEESRRLPRHRTSSTLDVRGSK